jgi:UDP-4-amino-4,6-dideoxy-N-acetyl-beta-L-altrosamine N-acetyltransferase
MEEFGLRAIREDDLEMVLRWRTSPDVTRYMLTDVPFDMENQRRWFERVSSDPDDWHRIITCGGKPAGVANISGIDRLNGRCAAGMYVAERELRSFKLYVTVLWNTFDFVFLRLGLNRLPAPVMSGNKGIVRLNEFCGYKREGVLRRHVFKYGEYHDVTLMAILRDEWLEKKERENLRYQKLDWESL